MERLPAGRYTHRPFISGSCTALSPIRRQPISARWILLVLFSLLLACTEDRSPSLPEENVSVRDCVSIADSRGLTYPLATHKLGDVFLKIPMRHISPPLDCIQEIDKFGLTICWPNIWDGLRECEPVPGSNLPVTGQMRVYMSFLGDRELRPQNRAKLELFRSQYGPPVRVPGTQIDGYLLRNSANAGRYTLSEHDPDKEPWFADCSNGHRCSEFAVRHDPLVLRYVFPIEHIEHWVDIERSVKTYVSSLVVEVE